MVDNFSLLLSHVLIVLTFWLLTRRDDLDNEPPPPPEPEPVGFAKRRMAQSAKGPSRNA